MSGPGADRADDRAAPLQVGMPMDATAEGVIEAELLDGAAAPADEAAGTRMGRDAAIVTVCTLASRLTGFVRVLVAAAVLGNNVLGDTYHAANTMPNLLFELVAGGVLQAVLVPTFVASRRRGGDEELGRTAGVIVAALTAGLAILVVVGIALSPLIARALTSGEGGSQLVSDKIDVLTPMLIVFIPQVLFYGVGMVATAALAARRRFVAAALAPGLNNAVVITGYLLYRQSRHGAPASLDLTPWQFALIAGGTTLAVVAFTAVPAIVLSVQGVRWRPRWQPHHDVLRSLRGAFGWAMLSVAGTLVPTAAAAKLGYGAPGGVAVFTMSFAFFVLPHALVAVPVATTMAPRVAESWQAGHADQVGGLIQRSTQMVVPLLLLAGAGMTALAWPIARVASFGEAASQGLAPIAHTLAIFGPGLLGYGLAFTMTRVLFSIDDVRRAAILVSCSAVIGVVSMVIASEVFDQHERAAALALGYGITQTLSAILLTARVRRRTGAPIGARFARLTGGSVVAAIGAAAVMFLVQQSFGISRTASVAAIVVAGAAGIATFGALAVPLAGVHPTALLHRGRRPAS